MSAFHYEIVFICGFAAKGTIKIIVQYALLEFYQFSSRRFQHTNTPMPPITLSKAHRSSN